MAKIKFLRLLASIIICQLAGIIGSFFTASSVSSWYPTLAKPVFNPPSWLFGPVWTLLYLLMGISLYIIWTRYKDLPKNEETRKAGRQKELATKALIFFAIQLVLNTLWSILFFGFQSPAWAFVEILILLGMILATVFYSYRLSKPAAYLLVPYVLWVSFAAVLNLAIFLLN